MTTKRRRSFLRECWAHPWGRWMVVGATVTLVGLAIRTTAVVTLPILAACAQVALPLAIGFTIAYILTPLVDLLERVRINRIIGAAVLFLLSFAAAVLVGSMVVPEVLRQSADLISRSFQDRFYLDYNGSNRCDPGEPWLSERSDERGVRQLWLDRNENGQRDEGEPRFEENGQQVRLEPSLLGATYQWLGEQQARIERMVGTDLDSRASVFLRLYAQETDEIRAILDAGLNAARQGLEPSRWPIDMQVDPGTLPPLTADWEECWPGALRAEVATARERLLPEYRDRWQRVMGWYGRCFAYRHHQLAAAWLVLVGREPPPAVPGPPVEVGEPLPGAAGQILASLRDSTPEQYASLLRQAVADEIAVGKVSQGQEVLEKLRAAEEAGAGYAVKLMTALRREGRGSGGAAMHQFLSVVAEKVQASLASVSERLAQGVTGAFANIDVLLSLSLDCILVPIYAFFLTVAMPTIRRTTKRYLPAAGRNRTTRIVRDIERVVAAFFRGRLIVCLICAVLVWLGFFVLGVPNAALFGLLIGLATAVPLAGLLFLIPACFVVLLGGGDNPGLRIGLVLAIYAVVQTLEMTVLTPTIMGREVELHPVTLIIALVLCGKLLGILGLILAVPIAASIRILAREFVLPRLRGLAELPTDSRMWLRAATDLPPPVPPPPTQGGSGPR